MQHLINRGCAIDMKIRVMCILNLLIFGYFHDLCQISVEFVCFLWLQIIVSCSHDLCQIYVEFVVFFGCKLLLVVLMIYVRFLWSLLCSLVANYC